MKLYSYYRSTSSWRVRIVLGFKGLAYTYHPVNLAPDVKAQASPDFDALNPMRQIPILEWEEIGVTRRLCQSVAICEYLEERHPEPALLPASPFERARVRQAVELVNSGIQPLQNVRTLASVRDLAGLEGESAARRWAHATIANGLAALEHLARAHDGPYLIGEEPSLADAFLVPQLYNARRYEVDLAEFSRLLEIEDHAIRLEAFARAHPDRQPDAPSHGGGPRGPR